MVDKDNPNSIHKPVGLYTHVATVTAKKLIFIAGQVPVDKDGKIVGVDPTDGLNAERRNRSHVDLAAQVRQTMLNVKEAVESAGGSLKNLVRLDTFVVTSRSGVTGLLPTPRRICWSAAITGISSKAAACLSGSERSSKTSWASI